MDLGKQDIWQLLDNIHADLNECSLESMKRFIPMMNEYDFKEIIRYQIKFDTSYLTSFILSTPSLWSEMSSDEWIQLIHALNPRPNPISIEIFNSGYIDIYFLCKYIRVNAIDFFLKQYEFSSREKERVLKYFHKISFSLFIDDLELEDLDGEYFINFNEIEKVRSELVSTGKFLPFDFTIEEFAKYIEVNLIQYRTHSG